ncbi:MAG: hypothetical protein R2750_01645 [Bacteroidales bacterium]
MKNKKFKFRTIRAILGLAIIMLAFSCTKETETPPVLDENFNDGVFIVNEGAYFGGTGTITFLKRDGSQVLYKIYQEANLGLPLGNIVQSMNIIDDIAFIAVNNGNQVEMAATKTFQSLGNLPNIDYPAYIIGAGNNKIYISSWDNTVKIYTTDGTEYVGQIDVGTGPTRMIDINSDIWVLNQGGLSVDSTISIIDKSNDQVKETKQVYPVPSGIQQDKNGLVWVLCTGKGFWQGGASEGHLIAIDPVTYAIQKDFIFPDTINHPEKLAINNTGDVLFYNYPGGVYKFEINSSSLENSPFVARPGMFYSLACDPKDNVIYVSDPVDYVQDGWVYRYHAATGSVIDSLKAGIVPREYHFVD